MFFSWEASYSSNHREGFYPREREREEKNMFREMVRER
jgi:hypothetical protein